MEAHIALENVRAFLNWISENGGKLHPDVFFKAESSGYSAIARQDIPPDTTVVSCPFTLAITPNVSRNALSEILSDLNAKPTFSFDGWSERQLICSYICMHWILSGSTYAF